MIVVRKQDDIINKFMSHTVDSPLLQFYINKQGGDKLLLSLPICPKCERTGLRDKGWALHRTMRCPHCGYHGHATHQLSTYVDEGMYK